MDSREWPLAPAYPAPAAFAAVDGTGNITLLEGEKRRVFGPAFPFMAELAFLRLLWYSIYQVSCSQTSKRGVIDVRKLSIFAQPDITERQWERRRLDDEIGRIVSSVARRPQVVHLVPKVVLPAHLREEWPYHRFRQEEGDEVPVDRDLKDPRNVWNKLQSLGGNHARRR